MKDKQQKSNISRRDFLSKSALAGLGFTILPSHVIGGLGHKAPSDKLNIAGVGIGGMGKGNLEKMTSENIVALCDVDWKYSAKTFEKWPKAKKFKDYRKMLDQIGKEIDAVVVATADHTHACISTASMKLGKHVYVQKPLTHSVYESRVLTEMAEKYKVATQMGNQGNSGEGIRQICEWIWDGAIGEIEYVDAWTNRPIWPQGLERPEEKMRVPKTLDWELFLGPAPMRPYNEIYTPWNWRGWWDFGTGALGDMACHILDPVFKAMKLQYPKAVEASSTQVNTESAPNASKVHYWFPQRPNLPKVAMPELKVTWYDGGLLPPTPPALQEAGVSLSEDWSGGVMFHGTKGIIKCGCYGKNPKLLPKSLDESYTKPPKTIRRIETSHEMDWVRACKESPESRVQPSSHFGYSGPLNEMVVMGVVATRLQDLRRRLEWDGKNMKFTNISASDEIRVVTSDKFTVIDGHPHFDTKHKTMNALEAANEYIKHTYHNGFEL